MLPLLGKSSVSSTGQTSDRLDQSCLREGVQQPDASQMLDRARNICAMGLGPNPDMDIKTESALALIDCT